MPPSEERGTEFSGPYKGVCVSGPLDGNMHEEASVSEFSHEGWSYVWLHPGLWIPSHYSLAEVYAYLVKIAYFITLQT